MENNIATTNAVMSIEQLYAYAANLYVNLDKNTYEIKQALVEKGMT